MRLGVVLEWHRDVEVVRVGVRQGALVRRFVEKRILVCCAGGWFNRPFRLAHALFDSIFHLVLVVAVNASFLERSQLQIIRRVRVQVEQFLELPTIEVHCAHFVLRGKQVFFVGVIGSVGLVLNVAL